MGMKKRTDSRHVILLARPGLLPFFRHIVDAVNRHLFVPVTELCGVEVDGIGSGWRNLCGSCECIGHISPTKKPPKRVN